ARYTLEGSTPTPFVSKSKSSFLPTILKPASAKFIGSLQLLRSWHAALNLLEGSAQLPLFLLMLSRCLCLLAYLFSQHESLVQEADSLHKTCWLHFVLALVLFGRTGGMGECRPAAL